MKKHVMMFILLKLIELSGFVFIPYIIGRIAVYYRIFTDVNDIIIAYWGVGILCCCIIFGITLVMVLFIAANWSYVTEKWGDKGGG